MRKPHTVSYFAALALSISALIFSTQSLARSLEMWSASLMFLALASSLILIIRPLYARRGSRRSGLPSRYERVKDPWRALDKGEDPTVDHA